MAELKAGVIPVTPFEQNCTVLWDAATKRAAVVDPGGDVPRILEAVDRLGLTVERILLTHGHLDHAGGAAALREALLARAPEGSAVPVEGPDERDRFLLVSLEAQGRGYGMTEARSIRPDRWLTEGDSIDLWGHHFEVRHCPGHTPGHIVFVDLPGRFALVGDVLFRGSIGRTDFPYGDHAALITAIQEKLLPLPDDLAFICGHGPGSTIGAERRGNPFLAG